MSGNSGDAPNGASGDLHKVVPPVALLPPPTLLAPPVVPPSTAPPDALLPAEMKASEVVISIGDPASVNESQVKRMMWDRVEGTLMQS